MSSQVWGGYSSHNAIVVSSEAEAINLQSVEYVTALHCNKCIMYPFIDVTAVRSSARVNH